MTTDPTWLLSDGTKVRLGGRVEGDGPAAVKLRYDLDTLREGDEVAVPMFGWRGCAKLDLNDIEIVHYWIMNKIRFAKATIVSAPELPASTPEPGETHESSRRSSPPHVPGRVY